MFAARSWAALTDAVSQATSQGGLAHAFPVDLESEASIAEFAARVANDLGPVDILVNCAGISPTFRSALDLKPRDWDTIFAVNVRGPVLLSITIARQIANAGRSGSIVNIGSAGGLVPVRNALAYSVSKAALLHATRALALELADVKIRVNAVAPGYLATDMTETIRSSPETLGRLEEAIPLGRIGSVEDVTSAVLFLSSSHAEYITGACLTIDGGYTSQLRWPG